MRAFLLAVFTLFLPLAGSANAPKLPRTKPLKIEVPALGSRTLSCGLQVLWLESHELPLVQAQLMIPGGNILDQIGRAHV